MCKVGFVGVVLLLFGIVLLFIVGVCIVSVFGYIDVVSMMMIGVGVVIYIVGFVIGVVIGVSFDVIVFSIVIGFVKVIIVMVGMLIVVNFMGLKMLCFVMIFGGLVGIVSGVSVGFVVMDCWFVLYGVLVVMFYIGIGCLFGLLLLFFMMCVLVGG